jgi:hypothetical protein
MGNGSPRVKKLSSSSNSGRLKKSEHPAVMETLAGSFYRQIDPRMKQKIMDSRMIQEDRNAIANLSEEFIHTQFNPNRFMEALGRRFEDSEVGS